MKSEARAQPHLSTDKTGSSSPHIFVLPLLDYPVGRRSGCFVGWLCFNGIITRVAGRRFRRTASNSSNILVAYVYPGDYMQQDVWKRIRKYSRTLWLKSSVNNRLCANAGISLSATVPS